MPEDDNCSKTSDTIYNKIKDKNIEVIFDDRNCGIGKKLSDNELIGIPIQIIIGKRDLANNVVEIKNRLTNSSNKISLDSALDEVLNLINSS